MTEPTVESTTPIDDDERDYFRKRSADHKQLAENARDSGSRDTHLKLQKLYQDRSNHQE